MTRTDQHHMLHALRLAATGTGRTAPNPSVGCIIVKDDRVVGAARTDDGGRPHAETQALAQAGDAAKGATVYSTLEPCAHHGVTPPCAEALVAAGVARVVIAAIDPDPRVASAGVRILRKAGIEVTTGVCEEEAHLHHRAFFKRLRHRMPHLSLKIATSLDGFITSPNHHERWVTGPESRAHVHMLRARHDAILTGIGTVLADDPALTCRLPGMEDLSPVRIALDTRLRIPLSSQLVATAQLYPTWVITTAYGVEQAASHATDLSERGVKLLVLDTDTRIAPDAALKLLAAEGLTSVFLEAGPQLASAFLEDDLVDTLYWYRSQALFGTGQPALTGMAQQNAMKSPRLRHAKRVAYGPDQLDIYDTCSPA